MTALLALLSATDVPFVLKAPGKTMPRYQLQLPVNPSFFRFPHFGLLPVTALALLLVTDVPFVLKAPGKTMPRYQLYLPVLNLSLFRFPHFGLLPVTALAVLSAKDVSFVLKAPGRQHRDTSSNCGSISASSASPTSDCSP
jgi:hypothetical protein